MQGVGFPWKMQGHPEFQNGARKTWVSIYCLGLSRTKYKVHWIEVFI